MSDDGADREPAAARPMLVSAGGLTQIARSRDLVTYWAGPRQGHRYELTETPEGRVFVRYLPEGVAAGDPRATFLTVGSYPRADAFADVDRAARRKGAVSMTLPDGGLAVYDQSRPSSVYLGYRGIDYQIEVYHPDGAEARRLVALGQVAAVGGRRPEAGPRATSAGELRTLTAFLQLPLHWAGPKRAAVLELTQTAEGRVFVRYLPAGARPGDRRAAFLTVATYPQANGWEAVRAAAKRKGAASVELARGGLAVYDRNRPTSIYLSYPKAEYQVEVYHPDPREALRLVTSGEVAPLA